MELSEELFEEALSDDAPLIINNGFVSLVPYNQEQELGLGRSGVRIRKCKKDVYLRVRVDAIDQYCQNKIPGANFSISMNGKKTRVKTMVLFLRGGEELVVRHTLNQIEGLFASTDLGLYEEEQRSGR